MTDYDELEERWLQRLNNLSETAQENGEYVLGAIVLAVFGIWSGVLDPDWPAWWPIIPIMGITALIVGYLASDKIYALIPNKQGILLIALRADKDGGAVYEIYEDDWEDMTVSGTLYEWAESPRRVYECREYIPEDNHAIANWREAEPASAILDKRTPEDALEAVSELREVYEPEAARARRLQRRLRGIVRKLDQERTKARARQLDQETGLESIDSKTIAEILEEEVPEDIHPHAGGGDTPELEDVPDPKGAVFGADPEGRIEIEQDENEAIGPSYDSDEVGI
jgi:PHD/YefM family antitoxin component YafN of YafNO toxin-antitoxin module